MGATRGESGSNLDHAGSEVQDDLLDAQAEQSTSQIVRALDRQLQVKHLRRNMLLALLGLVAMFALGATMWPAFTDRLPRILPSTEDEKANPDRATSRKQFEESSSVRDQKRVEELTRQLGDFQSAPDKKKRDALLKALRKAPRLGVRAVARAYTLEPSVKQQALLIELSGQIGGEAAKDWQLGLARKSPGPLLRVALVNALARTRRPGTVQELARLFVRPLYKPERTQIRDLIVALAQSKDLAEIKKLVAAASGKSEKDKFLAIERAITTKLAGRNRVLELTKITDLKKLAEILNGPSKDWSKLYVLRRLVSNEDPESVKLVAGAVRLRGKHAPDPVSLNAAGALIRLAERSAVAESALKGLVEKTEAGPGRAVLAQLMVRYGGAVSKRILNTYGKSHPKQSKWADKVHEGILQREKEKR